jgi:ADP-heptose:LPS heptosyltransferase
MKPVGDTILATPFFYVLKKNFPDCHITVVVNTPFAEMIQNNPYCDEVLPYDKKKPLAFLFKILLRKFDVSIDLMNNPRTSQISLFAGARYRIGLLKPRNFFYNLKIDLNEFIHEIFNVDNNLKMLRFLGIEKPYYEFYYKPDAGSEQFARNFLKEKQLKGKIIGLNISATTDVQRWPTEKFLKLGEKLVNETDYKVLIIWGPEDRDKIEKISLSTDSDGNIVFAPSTTLNQMGALIENCSLLVTGDGGPKHMAVAMKIPTLTIYGGVSAKEWNPLDTKRFPYITAELDCYPCHNKKACKFGTLECLHQISVERVFKTINKMEV